MILQSVLDQKDFLLNVYNAEYDNECYTDQHHMIDIYYKEPYKEPIRPLFQSTVVIESIYPYSIDNRTLSFRF
jgi:hypothetical protein